MFRVCMQEDRQYQDHRVDVEVVVQSVRVLIIALVRRAYEAVGFLDAHQVEDVGGDSNIHQLHEREVDGVAIPHDIAVAEDVDDQVHLLGAV